MSMQFTRRAAMVTAILLGIGAAQVHADDMAGGTPSTNSIHQALKSMVTGQGYAITSEGKFKEGWEYFYISVPHNGTQYSVRLNLSAGGQNLWFTIPTGTMTETQKQDAARLLRMLEVTVKLGTARVVCFPNGNVTVETVIPVKGCTPEDFKTKLKEILESVDEYKKDLLPSMWL